MNEVIAFILPGMMYFWVLFIGQGPMQEVIFDREGNILPRILASPVTLPQFILAKMLRCFIICGLAMVLLVVFSRMVYGVTWGNPLLLAVAIIACALSMTGLLAAIYSLARTREQARTLSSTILLGMAMVGGGMFPFENLPGFLQAVGQFTPNRWGNLALRGVAGGKPFADLIAPFASLIVLGLLGCGIAFVLFRRQLSTGRGK